MKQQWLVQTKFNMGTLDLDNHNQSFWQLIHRVSGQLIANNCSQDS